MGKGKVFAKIKGYKKYLKTLALSTALAFFMLYIALGLMFFAKRGNPVPAHFVLLIAAIFFVIFSVFYESKERGREKGKGKREEKGKEGFKSLIKGLFLAISATFSFVAIIGGVKLTVGRTFPIGIETFISALAICIIVSMVFLSLLKPLAQ
ncbi:MAG: hypothetical protein N2V78_04775 [Methanophagales archaeon]|nr:hypothetical protein [Methanophagales archaeon]MCW3141725.1 hypothetical protein [Methanophagales archaeon]